MRFDVREGNRLAAGGEGGSLMAAARMLVGTYFLLHGRLKMRGGGWLIRKCMRIVPSLKSYLQPIPGAGTAVLDLGDSASYDVLNVLMGDPGPNGHLYPWLERLLWPGQVVWDIGANVGYFSLYLSRSLPALKAIHAFEPNPSALKTLGSMFKGHPMVHVHSVGLGSRNETLAMQCPSHATPYGTLARNLPNAEMFPVQLRNGDAYCAEAGLDLPDIVKIDVEGFEGDVFAGLKDTFERARPIVIFEHCWLDDRQLAKIAQGMPERYGLLFLLRDGSSTFKRSRRGGGDDAILFPVEKEPLIAACREEFCEEEPDGAPTTRGLKLGRI